MSLVHKIICFCADVWRFFFSIIILTFSFHMTVFIYEHHCGNISNSLMLFMCFMHVLICWKWAFVHTFNTIWHHMVLPGCKNTYTWVSLWLDITRRHHGEQLGEGDVWIWEVTCPCSSFWKRSWGSTSVKITGAENSQGTKSLKLSVKLCTVLESVACCGSLHPSFTENQLVECDWEQDLVDEMVNSWLWRYKVIKAFSPVAHRARIRVIRWAAATLLPSRSAALFIANPV